MMKERNSIVPICALKFSYRSSDVQFLLFHFFHRFPSFRVHLSTFADFHEAALFTNNTIAISSWNDYGKHG